MSKKSGCRNYPILFEDKADCCSCSACMAGCPVDAITMKEDKEGFLYPFLDESKCIRCYLCINICPIKK